METNNSKTIVKKIRKFGSGRARLKTLNRGPTHLKNETYFWLKPIFRAYIFVQTLSLFGRAFEPKWVARPMMRSSDNIILLLIS